MSDKTAINLLRIRACDEDWNEADHPRADNGQFTSGGGGGGVSPEASAPAENAPAPKPKKARKPKVEKDWEPNDAEKVSKMRYEDAHRGEQ